MLPQRMPHQHGCVVVFEDKDKCKHCKETKSLLEAILKVKESANDSNPR